MTELLLTSATWAVIVLAMLHFQAKERTAHRDECRELANRIQRPELLPTGTPTAPQETFTEEDHEWAKVGTIDLGERD